MLTSPPSRESGSSTLHKDTAVEETPNEAQTQQAPILEDEKGQDSDLAMSTASESEDQGDSALDDGQIDDDSDDESDEDRPPRSNGHHGGMNMEDVETPRINKPFPNTSPSFRPFSSIKDGLAMLSERGISQAIIDTHRADVARFLSHDSCAFWKVKAQLRKMPQWKTLSGPAQAALLSKELRKEMERRVRRGIDAESKIRRLSEQIRRGLSGPSLRGRSAYAWRSSTNDTPVTDGDGYSESMKRSHRLVPAEGMGMLPLPADIEKEGREVCDKILHGVFFDQLVESPRHKRSFAESRGSGAERAVPKRSRSGLDRAI